MRHLIKWLLAVAIVQGGLLLLLAWILPGFHIGSLSAAVVAALIFAVANVGVWPLIYDVAARFNALLFPLLCFVLEGAGVLLLSRLVPDFGGGGMDVDGLGTAIAIAVGLTVGNTVIGALFSLQDDAAYDRFVTHRLRHHFRGTPRSEVPGILFLEIDGLAEPILRRAIAAGYMPTLRRWLDGGSHTLTGWEPDLSSQTSASQAGILLGDNAEIPAFRWYDKPSGKLMVSSHMSTARELEQRLTRGEGLLIAHGGSRWNVFSGDAPDCLCTYSTFGDRSRTVSGSYLAYFSDPFTLPRTIALFACDVVRERYQAWQQRRQDVRPRIVRTWKYALVRAATTTLMQEASVFMLIADMYRGVPAVYNTFFSYDEVAHHSGIDRPDAFNVLRTLDEAFARLERAAAHAPRPYHFVVLSDHGQSLGATFRQRHGRTLDDVVRSLVADEYQVTGATESVEDWHQLNLALSEALKLDHAVAHLAHRAMRGHLHDGHVELGPDGPHHETTAAQATAASDVIVLASGNLGLISFPRWPERMTYEQISAAFPKLLPGLVATDWVGFVMVRSEREGGLVIGPRGTYALDRDAITGNNPLADYGPRAAAHLRRTDGFTNAPDILVMSRYDPSTEEVAAFEELVGSHGGLGGPQTRPFVLHPAHLDPGPAPIVGAAALHAVLRRWAEAPQPAASRATVGAA